MRNIKQIVNATLHGKEGLWTISIAGETISEVAKQAATETGDENVFDARGGLVSEAFADPHYHPDKSYSLSDVPEGVDISDVDPNDGFTRAALIKAGFTAENVATRATRALKLANSNGVTALRATADVDTVAGMSGIEGLLVARDNVKNLMEIDLVAFPQEGIFRDSGVEKYLEEALKLGVEFVGAWPNVEASREEEEAHVRYAFDLAEKFDVGVDIHADCFLDENEQILEFVAEETIKRGFEGRVLASHCTALELYSQEVADRVIAKVVEAQIAVSVIPLNLADGGPRGLSRIHDLIAAGARVSAGTDNMNDGWYPLGTVNPRDRANMTFFGGSFDKEEDVNTVWDMVTKNAWDALGKKSGIEPGLQADFVIFDVPTREKALQDPLSSLTVLHRGNIVSERRTASVLTRQEN